MKHLARLSLASLVVLASATVRAEPWLSIIKSETGFLFQGMNEGKSFSFDIPGSNIRNLEDRGRAFSTIDSVTFQVFLTERKGEGALSALEVFVAEEKTFATSMKAQLEVTAHCSALTLNHREWRVQMPNGAVSLYVAAAIGNSIFVMAAGADPGKLEQAKAKFTAACTSFKT